MFYVNQYVARQRELNVITVEYEDITCSFLDIGASVIDIQTKDADDQMECIVVKYDNLRSYFKNSIYLNTSVGPTSGRIKDGTFTLNDTLVKLDKNDGSNHLHGGKEGFSHRRFHYEVIEGLNQTKVVFTYTRKSALSKYPGTSEITVIYTVKNNELLIEFKGTTDEDTLLNMTNHAYFNLSGNLKRDVLGQELWINADKAMELDETYAPVSLKSVRKMNLDFRKSRTIGSVMTKKLRQSLTKGIDHPFLFSSIGFDKPQAMLSDPESKRMVEVYTTYPCMVVYTHNFPSKSKIMHRNHEPYLGVCLETQYEPNGINIDGLHNAVLRRGETYYEKTLYKFKVKENI